MKLFYPSDGFVGTGFMHPNQGNHAIAYGGTSPMEEIGAGLQSHSLPCGGVTSLGPGGFYPISYLSAQVEFFLNTTSHLTEWLSLLFSNSCSKSWYAVRLARVRAIRILLDFIPKSEASSGADFFSI